VVTKQSQPDEDDPAQSQRFREMAKEVGAIDAPSRFVATFETVSVMPKSDKQQQKNTKDYKTNDSPST
jgi:hypothetical protein